MRHGYFQQGNDTDDFSSLSTHIGAICKAINEDSHDDARRAFGGTESTLDGVRKRLNEFIQMNVTSPTGRLWIMYLEMIGILNKFIAAERAGIWDMHLQATEEMLPYIVAAGHNKYTSCLSHDLSAMKELPPDVQSEFEKGNFAVRKQPGKFNGVWSDMALEQTFNKDAKTKLFQGIAQRPETISKYLKALPSMTAASEKVLLMAHLKQDPHQTGEVSTSERDLQQVRNIKSVVTEKMMNPFQQSNDAELVNISTGQVAQSLELIEAKEKGLKALAKAETEDSVKVEPVRLKTFVEKVKKKSTLQQTKQLYIEESSVVRNLCFAESLGHKEKVDAFSHEWAEYPSSLFTPDELHPSGFSMRKGNKSDYATMLKATIGSQWKELEQLPNVESGTGYFIDLMAFVQRYQELGSTTFEELSAKYLEKILRL